MALVEDELGNVLGNVNTIQNANTHTVNTSFNMSKFYKNLGLQKKRNPKQFKIKFLTHLLDLQLGLTRLKVELRRK